MSDRGAREREFFNRKAEGRKLKAIPIDRMLPDLRLEAGVTPGSAQDHAIRLLGNCNGLSVLDIGAGEGWASLHFASLGARVTSTEVSEASLDLLRDRAIALGLDHQIRPVLVENEILPFEDHAFDVVFGNAVLHHLDLDIALPEIRRVLKPRGFAVFMEPLAHHPVVRVYRRLTPRKRTLDERPLSWRDIDRITEVFSSAYLRPVELLGLATLALRRTPIGPRLDFFHAVDSWLFSTAPWTRHYCRAVVMRLQN